MSAVISPKSFVGNKNYEKLSRRDASHFRGMLSSLETFSEMEKVASQPIIFQPPQAEVDDSRKWEDFPLTLSALRECTLKDIKDFYAMSESKAIMIRSQLLHSIRDSSSIEFDFIGHKLDNRIEFTFLSERGEALLSVAMAIGHYYNRNVRVECIWLRPLTEVMSLSDA